VVLEFGRGVDHAERLDEALHLVEAADFAFDDGQDLQADAAGGGAAFLHVHVQTEAAGERLAGVRPRTGARDVQHVADAHRVDKCVGRLGDGGKLDRELAKLLLGGGRRFLLGSGDWAICDGGPQCHAKQHSNRQQGACLQNQ